MRLMCCAARTTNPALPSQAGRARGVTINIGGFVLALLAACLICPSAARAQCASQWLPSPGVAGVNGIIRAMTMWDPDGPGPIPPRLVVGGAFTTAGGVAANRVALYDPANGQWSALGVGVNNAVYALATLPTGELVVGGQFTTAGGLPIPYLARWNGTTWSGFGSGLGGFGVYALATLPNGDLIAGGTFTTPTAYIARWNGSAWSAMGSGMNNYVYALAAMPGGDVIAGGQFTTAGGGAASRIARWNSSAGSWSSLGAGTNFQVYAVTPMPNGDVVAAGIFSSAGSVSANRIARWSSAGSSWSSFGTGTDGDLFCLMVLPNGDLLIGGFFNTAGGVAATSVVRWNGTTFVPLGAGTNAGVRALALLPNGEVAAGGDFLTAGNLTTNRFARYTTPSPTIATHPQDFTTCPLGSAVFSVAGSGSGPFTYQWRKAGVPIDTATNPSAATAVLELPFVQTADLVLYDCIVTTACGSVTSNAARLSVGQRCSLADLAGGTSGNIICPDGIVDGSDFIAFINAFSIGDPTVDPLADVAGGGDDGLSPDGIIDGSDFIAFINAYGVGC